MPSQDTQPKKIALEPIPERESSSMNHNRIDVEGFTSFSLDPSVNVIVCIQNI